MSPNNPLLRPRLGLIHKRPAVGRVAAAALEALEAMLQHLPGPVPRNLRRPHPLPRPGLDETDVESLVEGASNPLKHRQRMATVVGILEAGR